MGWRGVISSRRRHTRCLSDWSSDVCSSDLDWSRQRFTMDPAYCHAVRVMFKKLYSEGLIHRGDYLVNWDPVTQTALADDEVEYEEKAGFLRSEERRVGKECRYGVARCDFKQKTAYEMPK